MRYQLAIFDFDGTLADSLPWFFRAMDEAGERYRFRRIDAAEVEQLRGQEPHQIMLQLGLPAWKLPLIARFMRMRMAQEIASISLFPGIATELERLSDAGVKLSIVSSNSEHNVRQVLGHRHAALFQRFECGVSLLGKGVRLQRVLRAHRVAPNDAIYVGDELRDLHAAHGEQIPFGAVGWGYARLEALAVQSPEVVFSRVEEISQVLAAGECR